MKRRALLRQLGGVGVATALAGCVADRPAAEDGTAEPGTQPAVTDGGNDTESHGNGNESDGDAADAGASTDPPSLAGTQIETTGTDSEATHEAVVTFDEGSVTVDGTITAPTPCHDAAVQRAAYDESGDKLRFVVETVQTDTDMLCTQVISGVAYTLTAEFDGGLPGNVVVVHEGASETTTVANVTAGDADSE
ncbi:hypothetical protein SAMN06269185_1482 [Natronoarchaeum philippinense]|uniref:Uncharacterized protein n=1 Tax=Natronoarchaeum philippinense TaxID=558529 RepID=A0A285NRB9_NATPI|nr:hypothetical protein [Natronoarchaeum philippinense]SNZ12074.1 hypothetical protein SAMN06269185_1482 [Natronoarchaeum philippinense]